MKNREDKISEIDIINGLKNNNSQVHTYVVSEFLLPLTFFGHKITGNKEDAEEIALTALNSLFSSRNNFEHLGNIKALLYTIVKNASLNRVRNNEIKEARKQEYAKHEQSQLSQQLQEEDDKTTAMLERYTIETNLLNRIHNEIETLPERCREVFKYVYFEGLDAKTIGEKMGTSPDTARSQYRHAINLLRMKVLGKDLLLLWWILLPLCSYAKHFLFNY